MINQQIFNDAKKFAAQFGGFLKAAEAWAEVGSIQQAGDEAQARLDTARAQEQEAIAARQNALDDIAEVRAAFTAQCAAAKAGADKYAAEQKDMADRTMSSAQATAEEIIAGAKREASAIVSDANVGVADKLAERSSISAEIAIATQGLADLNAQITQAAAQRDRIKSEIVSLLGRLG